MEISEYKNIFENETTHFYYVTMHNLVLRLIKTHSVLKNPKILDAGCGTGQLVKSLSEIGYTYGIDISKEAIKYCRKRKLKNIRKGSVTQIPFADNSFDIITCLDVIYHQAVKNDNRAINEFARVLKPKGILILKVPAHQWLFGKHDKIVHTKKRYEINKLKNQLKRNCFIIKKISYGNMFLFPFAVFKRLIIDNIFSKKTSSDINKLPKILNSIFIYIGKIENLVFKYINLPFGLDIYAIAIKS
jgi:ubiquinone/menaquinone biosynthesis C-methylase UbiE